jgi:hypothetical protein
MAANINTKFPDELPIYNDLDTCDIVFLVVGTITLAGIALWALRTFWTRRREQQLWM